MVTTDPVELLRAEGLAPVAWANGPGERYSAHDHPYDKVIVATTGSIQFGLATIGEPIELTPGDRLDLPSGTRHDAVVGPDGVSCVEAHLVAGSLGGVAHRAAGSW